MVKNAGGTSCAFGAFVLIEVKSEGFFVSAGSITGVPDDVHNMTTSLASKQSDDVAAIRIRWSKFCHWVARSNVRFGE